MADDDNLDRPKGSERGEGRRAERRSDAGFDRWLVNQLRKLYDEVLEEEVPEDLIRVVRAFDAPHEEKQDGHRERPETEQPAGKRRPRSAGG